MKISAIVMLLAVTSPLVSALKGLKGDKSAHQRLLKKGDDEDEDGGIEIPDIEDILDGNCFSEVATVDVEGKGPVAMKDLQIGDKVMTGSNTYQPIYSFGHFKKDQVASFVQISTEQNEDKPLEMTGEHLVFVHGKTNPVRADSIQVGDLLQGGNGPSKIVQIDHVEREGLYAPFTQEGTLVVDGIVASSYISLQANAKEYVELQGGIATGMSQHKYVHMGLAPFRLMCMGVSSTVCESLNEQGLPHYVGFAIALNHWAHTQNGVIQTLVLLLIALLTGTCMLLENTLGAAHAPVVVVTLGTVYAIMKSNGLVLRRANKCKNV